MAKAKRTVKPLKDSGKTILQFRLGRTQNLRSSYLQRLGKEVRED